MRRVIGVEAPIYCLAIAAAVAVGCEPARAGGDLVTNGGFESTTLTGSYGFGSLYPSNQVTGWSTDGYAFDFAPNTADTTGAQGEYGLFALWGPNNGSANGFTSTSPAGGNFIAADGDYQTLPISQTINGLTAGDSYVVKFDWAGIQQYGYTGATTEQWLVSLGGQTIDTPVANDASHGFTGWMSQSMKFTATAPSESLSFLAAGTPSGLPPFTLLDGVSLSAVPEPATWSIMLVGLGGLGWLARRRRALSATRLGQTVPSKPA